MDKKIITAFAPATVANVNVGFDLLGYAIHDVGDRVSVEKIEEKTVIIEAIKGAQGLPLEASKNTSGAPLLKMIEELKLSFGFKISIEKGISIGSGMGGSAASAVAAVVAANELLDNQLSKEQLLKFSLIGEEVASGSQHPDNVVPALYGGLCLTTSMQPLNVIQLPTPGIYSTSFFPHIEIKTSQAREALKKEISLEHHTQQQAQLAGFLCGLYQGDSVLIKKSFNDFIIEPQRLHLIPGFEKAKQKALEMGAIGFGISGSGPSLFCWSEDRKQAEMINSKVLEILKGFHTNINCWTSPVNRKGAYVL